MRMPDEKDDTKLQMSPLIDMVFLLIIFFMTASHMSSSKNMDRDIPSASNGNVPKEGITENALLLAANGEGAYVNVSA